MGASIGKYFTRRAYEAETIPRQRAQKVSSSGISFRTRPASALFRTNPTIEHGTRHAANLRELCCRHFPRFVLQRYIARQGRASNCSRCRPLRFYVVSFDAIHCSIGTYHVPKPNIPCVCADSIPTNGTDKDSHREQCIYYDVLQRNHAAVRRHSRSLVPSCAIGSASMSLCVGKFA